MGKYSDMPRNERDWYATPIAATVPLFNGPLDPNRHVYYAEPFAGDGALMDNIYEITYGNSSCVWASDIEPQRSDILKYGYKDALDDLREFKKDFSQMVIISNPPWLNTAASGYQLNQIIMDLSSIAPTYLLLDGNYLFNKKSAIPLSRLASITPVGRVKWIPDSPYSGKENVAWFHFTERDLSDPQTIYHRK